MDKTPSAGDLGLIPDQSTRSHMMQLRVQAPVSPLPFTPTHAGEWGAAPLRFRGPPTHTHCVVLCLAVTLCLWLCPHATHASPPTHTHVPPRPAPRPCRTPSTFPAADASGETTPDPLPPCPHSLPPPLCQGLLQPQKPHTGHICALQGGASASSAPMSAWLRPTASSRARPPYAPRAGSTEPGAGGHPSDLIAPPHGWPWVL